MLDIPKLRSAVLIGFLFTILASTSVTIGQTRGFPNATAESALAIDTLLSHWQSIQNDLRISVGPNRRPEYQFRMLAREIPTGNGVERFNTNRLPPRIILVMGGLQGTIESAERFAMAVSLAMRDPADSRMAVFGYPNDGSICESGAVLRDMLTDLHNQSPDTKVSIVAHSMGALVARYAIEPSGPKAGCQVPCVDQLVMLCPPNHGSVLAQYADALEFQDALSKLQGGSLTFTQVIQSLVNDGLGEACEELVPDSQFLRELNNRSRATGVRYCTIAGTGGPITPLVRFASSVAFNKTQQRTRLNQLPNAEDALKRADELLLSDEFAQGLGDGAVSLRSAELFGVREFYTVPLNHGEWAVTDKPEVQTLVQRTAELLCGQQAVERPAPQRAKF